MFGFGKKEEKKKTLRPFPLTMLTTDYVVQGTAAGDTALLFGTVDGESQEIEMKDVVLRSATATEIPPISMNRFRTWGFSVIAYIPEAALQDLEDHEVWEGYERTLNGTFYIGPYIIRGRLKTIENDHWEASLPMHDVEISSMFPKNNFKMSAKFIAVNTNFIHGYEPD